MRFTNLLTSSLLLVSISIASGLIGLILGIIYKDMNWFSRSGSIITAMGILLISRPAIINQGLLTPIVTVEGDLSNDPKHYEKIGEAIPKRVREEVKSRRAVEKFGPVMTIIGTIIWGFGDLMPLP